MDAAIVNQLAALSPEAYLRILAQADQARRDQAHRKRPTPEVDDDSGSLEPLPPPREETTGGTDRSSLAESSGEDEDLSAGSSWSLEDDFQAWELTSENESDISYEPHGDSCTAVDSESEKHVTLSSEGSDVDSSLDSSEDSEIEIISPLPPPEQFIYCQEPLTSEMQEQIRQDLCESVNYHGRRPLMDAINLDMFGSNGLARCIEEPGSWIVISPEQSGKTGGEAGLVLVSMRLGHPSVYLIKDVQGNAEKVAKDLKSLLKPFGIIVKYVRGRKIWDQIRDLISQGFAQGKVLLVMTTQNTELECLNNFLEQEKITGLTVIADESDNIWSSEIRDPDATERQLRSQREKQMYRLLGSATIPAQQQRPLAPGSRVRSLIQVSATHIATIIWHCQWRLPFRYVSADKEALKQRGYALERDLKLVATLDPADVTKKNDYGMQSMQVIKELEEFARDSRSGRLMMVCLSPYVNAPETTTSFDIARAIVSIHVPDAVCIVMHGRGVNALYNKRPGSSASALDYSVGDGETIFVEEAPQNGDQDAQAADSSQASRKTQQAVAQAKRSKQASDAIKQFNKRFGLVTPLIVVGYNVIGRCASIRSRERVITYIIGAYQRGRSKADAEQMLMRSNGKSRKVRSDHGFDHVRLVTTEASFWIVQDLYDFTEEALQKSGTGRQEDLENWFSADYPERFMSLFADNRPWYRKTMGLLDMSRFRMAGKLVRPESLPAEEGPKRHLRKPEKKRRKVNLDITRSRLMRCIWAKAKDAPGHHFTVSDVLAYMDSHPEILTRDEFHDRQHGGAMSVLSSRCHHIKKVHDGTGCVTRTGVEWCRKHLEAPGNVA